MGPSFMKIWTCGSSPWSESRNAWTRMKNVNCASRLSKFGIFSAWSKWFPVTIGDQDETWLYHYDQETKQQSIEWRHSGSPRPKRFRVQKYPGKVLASIFGDQDGILLIDYLPKGRTISAEYYSSLLVQLKDISEENPAGSSPKGSCSCTTMPPLTGHWQPRRNRPTWASNFLITRPILRIWPHRTTTCSLDWENNWNVVTFRPRRRSLLPRRPG